mmetsp:Transcript_15428/g.42398  ORF Transcript_15428/g.42398 Transcript_15428/m.42398 type:complete len:925 (+) Transcript_15428:107-2881(+)
MFLLRRIFDILLACPQACRQLCSCVQGSPVAFVLITVAVLIMIFAALIFNICLAKLLTVPGAFFFNLGMLWLLLRLIVRALVFPGSIILWKRNTEASYRVEMSKQFAHHLEHLHGFLVQASRRSRGAQPGATLEGVLLGCMVVEGLARNFRIQQRDQVRFTAEQAHVKLLVQGVESWLGEAKVITKFVATETPLLDWVNRVSQSIVPVATNFELAAKAEAEVGACIERLEQLITIFIGLQNPQDNFCTNARRFLRVPTVGSLHQLRAELLVRYSGRHCWVRTASGRKIDAMFVSRHGAEGGDSELDDGLGGLPPETSRGVGLGGHSKSREEIPLKTLTDASRSDPGPVIVWCNPNAAYYETMAYESHWVDFYLSQGCSVCLFNYSGFGRSQGYATPSALAADGNAVVEFLKRRGFTQIGVHGRSIGGIAACAIAKAHSDVIKLLVADRTFSTLGNAARFTFGNWAVTGLSIATTWADNHENYAQARCYKVMICDPKDATIPDLASLRTAVAVNALEGVAPTDRLTMEQDKIDRVAEAWTFLWTLVGICDRDDAASDGHQCASCRGSLEAKRPARQPVVGKPAVDTDVRIDIGEDDTQQLVASSRPRADGRKCVVNTQWLEEHVELVRFWMAIHADIIRSALDMVGNNFNASGMSFDDALGRSSDDPAYRLKCFLANLQVWGSLGSREPPCPGTDKDIEELLLKGSEHQDSVEASSRLARLWATLTPARLSEYHRHLSRAHVAQVRREFRHFVSEIRRSLEPLSRDGSQPASQLCALVLSHLREIEGFMTAIYRFFQCINIEGNSSSTSTSVDLLVSGLSSSSTAAHGAEAVNSSDDSEEGRERPSAAPPRPTLDRSITGYVMCIDCGHNGILNAGELQHLALHLRAARFGKYANSPSGGSSGNGAATAAPAATGSTPHPARATW